MAWEMFYKRDLVPNIKGFTLIELVVVMAIIAVLSVMIIAAIQTARNASFRTAAVSEMRDIRAQMEAFHIKYGQLPPMGDCWSLGTNPPSLAGGWILPLNAMRDKGLISQEAVNEWSYDPWGNPYGYDDNYGQTNSTRSTFCSTGPDGIYPSGDDVCSHITHEAACICSLRCGCPTTP